MFKITLACAEFGQWLPLRRLFDKHFTLPPVSNPFLTRNPCTIDFNLSIQFVLSNTRNKNLNGVNNNDGEEVQRTQGQATNAICHNSKTCLVLNNKGYR
jgi:hypothetical protein